MALRLPFGKEERSKINNQVGFYNGKEYDPSFVTSLEIDIDPKDLSLMSTLIRRGDEHAKVVRGIVVWAKISAPVYWWCEMETYRAGHERLCSESTMHIDCQGLTGAELQEAKATMPMGKELTKVDFFSYQALRNIYKQRHNHRLPEWHFFCEWIEGLPFAQELILTGFEKED